MKEIKTHFIICMHNDPVL